MKDKIIVRDIIGFVFIYTLLFSLYFSEFYFFNFLVCNVLKWRNKVRIFDVVWFFKILNILMNVINF